MSTSESVKWLSSDGSGNVVVHKINKYFDSVANEPCNFVSIFGRAREGKSFLMNSLACREDLFCVSNAHESCTQGIDMSKVWMPLHDFSTADGGAVEYKDCPIKVGFLDAEGQGDKDVSYDSKLICPILLTSKCVIFNWKGDLQKDHLLNTLGIMARAAQNVALNANDGKKSCFGHLHIVFRDWQAANGAGNSCLSVQDTLFNFERSGAGHDERNRIRKLILEAFSSVRVWLFDPPSEYTKELKQKLVYQNTSSTFRTQVRALREALAQQLKEPTYLAGNVLTGRTYIPLTENIAEALNSGQVVLPSAMYLNVVKQDLQVLAKAYQSELIKLASTLVAEKAQQAAETTDCWVKTCEKFLSGEGRRAFAARSAPIASVYQSLGQDKLLNIAAAPGTPVAVILSEYAAQLQDIHTSSEAQFLALCSQQFHLWLQSTLPEKQSALSKTLREAIDVTDALLCIVSAQDIGMLDSDDDPVDSYADAVCEEVLVKMVTLVDDWLLLTLPQYAKNLAYDNKGKYSVVDTGSLDSTLRSLLHNEACFMTDLREAIYSQAPSYKAQWRVDLENLAYEASINNRSPTPPTATTVSSEQDGTEWSPLSDSLVGTRVSPDNAVAADFGDANIGEALQAEESASTAAYRNVASGEANVGAGVKRGTLTKAISRLAVSIEQQRLRAQAWAQSTLGLQFEAAGSTAASASHPDCEEPIHPKPVRKSFAQQKSDALKYARKLFGARVVARELDEGAASGADVADANSSDDSFVRISAEQECGKEEKSERQGRTASETQNVPRPVDSWPNGRPSTPVLPEESDSEGEQDGEEVEEGCEELMSETVSEITSALKNPLGQLNRPVPSSFLTPPVSVPTAQASPIPSTAARGATGRKNNANHTSSLRNTMSSTPDSPIEPSMLHFYKRCLADIYAHATPRCDVSRVQAVLAQDNHFTQTQDAAASLKKFEAQLCRKIHAPNRDLATLLSENDCIFLGDVDFNTDRPSRASLEGHMHDRRSPSPDRRASFGIPSSDSFADPVRECGNIIYKAGAYQVRFKDPIISKANCIFFHLFGRDRFMKVKIPKLSARTIKGGLRRRSNQLVEDGFEFGGRTYHFLGGEGQDGKGQAYFFATHDDCNFLAPVSVSEVRQALADFDQVGHVTDEIKPIKLMAASKMNARLMLGFSPTYPALTLTDNQVIVIDDVAAQDGGQGGIMTDGCGFISASLLHSLPFAIANGAKFCDRMLPTVNTYTHESSGDSVSYISTAEGNYPEDGTMRAVAALPNTIQIRLSCKKGLFKGCLTVTTDVRLCPENCVVMRQSMLKVACPTHITKNAPCTLFVNRTFEKAGALSPGSFRNAPAGTGSAGGGNPWTAKFSVDLALLLCHLGLPLDHVLRLALREVEEISDITRNRSVALEYVHRILRRFDRKDSDEADDEDGSEEELEQAETVDGLGSFGGSRGSSDGGANDSESTRSGSSAESNTDFQSAKYSANLTAESAALKALHYFVAGHDLREPQLQRYLSRLQTVALDKLRRLKFHLPHSAYLVGVPDPYGVLKEGEVFAFVPLGDAELRTSAVIHNCEVLVTRYPLHHPGDIRKLRAVQNSALSTLVGHSSNAVLFFSTQGARSQADKMGGGDFDGDEYCLIFNPVIVNAVTTVEPYHASDFPQVTVAAPAKVKNANMRDGLGVELLHSLLHHASNNKVGLYSTLWQAFADRNPASDNAKIYDHLARLALDAAKTGLECNSLDPPPLTEKPHYLSAKLPNVKNVYQSESVVGVVMDMIAQRVSALQPLSSPPTADPDIYMVIEDGEVIFDVVREINYHLQRQLAGQGDKWDLWERWKNHFDTYRVGVGRLSSANENHNNGNNTTTGTSTSAGTISYVEEQMQSLKGNFIEAFDAEARLLHTLDARYVHFNGYTARRVLAAIVYHLTYENCKSFANFYRVGFCWEICPAELHDNKKRSTMRKNSQHEYDLLPAMYLQDMYNLRF